MHELPYAEDVNYWKTGSTAPDSKLDQAAKMIVDLGGVVTAKAIGFMFGRSAVMVAFELGGEQHRITWPVLNTRQGEADTRAARIQAATFVWHDMKVRAMNYKVIGGAAFSDVRLIEAQGGTARELLYEGRANDIKLLT